MQAVIRPMFWSFAVASLLAAGCDHRVNPEVSEWQNRNKTLNAERDRLASALSEAAVTRAAFDEIATAVETHDAELNKLRTENEELTRTNDSLRTTIGQLQLPAIERIKAAGGVVTQDEATGTVTAIDLSGSLAQDDSALDVLPVFNGLKKLVLYGPAITNETMDVVSQLPQLEHLDLTRTAVGDAGLAKLVGLKNLRYLQLFRCDVTDEGFRSLAQLPRIEQIRCGQTRISDQGLQYIKDLKTVTALDLSDCNQVTDAGVEVIAGFAKLRFLKLWGKSITDVGVLKLAALENLEVVGFNDTAITSEGMKAFRGKTKLKEIHLVRCTRVGDDGIAELAGCTEMEYLDLRDTGISGKSLETIGKFTKLKILDLSETLSPGVDDANMIHLAGLTNLEDLNLWHTNISAAGLAHLAGLKKIRVLNLDKTKITDEALDTVAQLENLEWLHIGSNEPITDAGLLKLVACKKLKYLNISYDLKITEDGFYGLTDALPECKIEGF